MHQISKEIFWVGYIDWNLRNFHGYSTPSGSTYNAYLILDEKPTLIDTVKYYGFEESLKRIKEIIDPAKIQYIISNHTEMDHSGSIDKLLKFCPNAQVVCSPKGEEELKRHFKADWNFKVVNTGDELDIGSRKLKFMLMPMVHWPDSMATYSPKDKILFPNDAFGQHYASSNRFADQVGLGVIYMEAAKYYANIVLPYGQQVLKVLEQLPSFQIDIIAPSHGLIWRRSEDIKGIIQRYDQWARHQADNKATIIYDTMWKSTEQMANAIMLALDKAGIQVGLMNLQNCDLADIVTEVMLSKVVLFGTPILNNRMLPTMASLLMYLKGLKPKERFALSFGSYGWTTIGYKEVEDSIKEAGFELLSEGRYIKFIPDQKDLDSLEDIVGLVKSRLQ